MPFLGWFRDRDIPIIIPPNVAHCELISVQRAALVIWWLAHGEALTTGNVARLCGITREGAQCLMHTLAGSWDIRRERGRWYLRSWREPCITFDGGRREMRGAFLAWRLARGGEFTTVEAGAMLGCGREAARRILNVLSQVLPIYQHPRQGGGTWGMAWTVLARREEEG